MIVPVNQTTTVVSIFGYFVFFNVVHISVCKWTMNVVIMIQNGPVHADFTTN